MSVPDAVPVLQELYRALYRERGRKSAEKITFYKSVGVAVQGGVAAAVVVRPRASAAPGQEVER